MKNSYSEKQIEVSNILSSIDAPQVAVDEIMNMLEDKAALSTKPPFLMNEESIDTLKTKLADETDWRKKATLAARIISKNLE